MVDLRGFVLANVQPDSSREQSSILDIEVPRGTTVVIARDADRATFEATWGAMPADVVFVNQGGAASFGAPIVNGDEVWVLRDASGSVVDGPTITGTAAHAYSRVGEASTDWEALPTAIATPGESEVVLPTGIWLTEWSDADDYNMEFVELVVR